MQTSQYLKVMDILELVLQKVTKMVKGLEHLSHKESLWKMGFSSLEKIRLGDIISTYKNLRGR